MGAQIHFGFAVLTLISRKHGIRAHWRRAR
jgi:hypothetical protein